MDLHSGAPFWPLKNGLLHDYPAIADDERADVLVIGAGVTGALTAVHLAEAGADVVVLDKRDAAMGSTAATTGLLLYETDTDLLDLVAAIGEADAVRAWRAGREAIDAIAARCHTIAGGCGFARCDSLYLASSPDDARRLAAEYDIRAAHGFDVEWRSATALADEYGIERPAAILSRRGGQIDSYRFTHGLLQQATALGARVYDRSEVSRVDVAGDGIDALTARGPRVAARHVVWATGYESIEETQANHGEPHSTWAVVSEPVRDLGRWRDRVLMWETSRPYLYARLTGDDRVMLGGEDEPFAEGHADATVMTAKTERLLERFRGLFPDLELEIAYRWAGTFTTTPDGLPRIGTLPAHPHAWLALGYGGNGITFSMIAAHLIRDAWLGVDHPDARLFSFDRAAIAR